MLITWKYKDRGTFVYKLDPRTRLIFALAMMFSLIQFWDVRVHLIFLMLGLLQFRLARLTWREVKRAWMLVSVVVLMMTVITFLTGRGGAGVISSEQRHLLARLGPLPLGIFGWQMKLDVTAERIMFALSQMMRVWAISSYAIIIPYTIDPALYGVMFRGLGLPDKFAYAMDLSFRFVPSLGRDFTVTMDAQRARGYEVEKLTGGVLAQIRKLAPLIVPITINAIVGAEDIIDAMDLRCFGVGPRTWVHRLQYQKRDWALIGFSAMVFVGTLLLNFFVCKGKLWIPPFLLSGW